ncbi:TonB-dependent receptor plug domain-containing protein, partial [Roseateles sp. GG27B]
SGDSANGPGLSETKTTMRGFSDDQYNITFDGIPWGDTNNPAHHSTSFFPGSVIGGAVVERGPGNASNLGFATFGGSLNLFSKKAGA